jgi:LysR family glycine cleavage system transcriptional activator
MSFAKAAEELHVTPAALSFQVKSLEQHLGAPVFHRLNRAVSLTEIGIALLPGVADGFQALNVAWRAARRMQDTTTLTVTAGPAFTAKWMAPRFYEFARSHPTIELRFSASLKLVDLLRDDVDVAIRFGLGPFPDVYSCPMALEWVTPVMTPELAQRFPTIESLKNAPLIHDGSIDFLTPKCDWAAWFRATGIDYTPAHGPRFSGSDHAVDAALAGAGITLGRRALVIKDIADGRLVAPYGKALGLPARFNFLCMHGAENRPHIAAFREWVFTEIDRTAFVSDSLEILTMEAA